MTQWFFGNPWFRVCGPRRPVAVTSVCLFATACSRAPNAVSSVRAEADATILVGGPDSMHDAGANADAGIGPAGDASFAAFDAAGCTAPPPSPDCDAAWCSVPAGCFVMGSPATEWGHALVAEDQVAVTVSRPFVVRQHETTQAEWVALGFVNPSRQDRDGVDCNDPQCPVGHVTWFEALAYANELSQREGRASSYTMSGCTGAMGQGMVCTSVAITAPTIYECSGYRLLTHAEWEYAARAGTATPFYSGDITVYPSDQCAPDPNLEAIAWYCFNANGSTHPVERKAPNRWGLYDMIGNLDEWVNDVFRGLPVQPPTDPGATWNSSLTSARILRGCNYVGWSTLCRVANQDLELPYRGSGIRLARTLLTAGSPN